MDKSSRAILCHKRVAPHSFFYISQTCGIYKRNSRNRFLNNKYYYNLLLSAIILAVSNKSKHNLYCHLPNPYYHNVVRFKACATLRILHFYLELGAQSVSIKGFSSLFSAICSLMFPSFHVFGTKVRQFPRTAKAHSYQSIILEGVKSAACQISLCLK